MRIPLLSLVHNSIMTEGWNDDEQAAAAAAAMVAEDDQDMLEEEEEEDDILDTEGDTPQHQEAALLMRFCPHDSSMLYPQEDKQDKKLLYGCRLCRYTEPADPHGTSASNLIYRNERKKEIRGSRMMARSIQCSRQ